VRPITLSLGISVVTAGGGQMRATAPPPTGARASLEIDANPISFQKIERGVRG